MPEIKIQCPAKINLSLKVMGKRPDGFHNIESIMQTISLYDYLTITLEQAEKNIINLSGNSQEIPYNEKNLVYKAAQLFLDNANLDEKYRISVYIEKNIPIAAGLAGGSTDAAGTIFGLNKLFNNIFSYKQLHELCAKLGSDLNVCLEGGTLLAKGRGEIIESQDFKNLKISLIKPIGLGISAKEAYTKFSEKYSISDRNRNMYQNDLEWAIIDDYKELQAIKKAYPESVMSGSGSTYFLINDKFTEMAGYRTYNDLTTISHGVTEI